MTDHVKYTAFINKKASITAYINQSPVRIPVYIELFKKLVVFISKDNKLITYIKTKFDKRVEL